MARAHEVPGIDAKITYAAAAARVVSVRAAEVLEHSGAVLDLAEIEHVHDMRVATRRLRAALEAFRPCFPKKQLGAALREVKAIADALGERRDRDVAIAELEELGRSAKPVERAGIESLTEAFRLEQARANIELAPFVEERRLTRLMATLAGLVIAAERKASRS